MRLDAAIIRAFDFDDHRQHCFDSGGTSDIPQVENDKTSEILNYRPATAPTLEAKTVPDFPCNGISPLVSIRQRTMTFWPSGTL